MVAQMASAPVSRVGWLVIASAALRLLEADFPESLISTLRRSCYIDYHSLFAFILQWLMPEWLAVAGELTRTQRHAAFRKQPGRLCDASPAQCHQGPPTGRSGGTRRS